MESPLTWTHSKCKCCSELENNTIINQLYSIGDLAIITGANSSKTFPNGDSCYYYENDVDGDSVIDSISESYSSSQEFTGGGWSYANEGYLHYLDELS